MELARYTDCVKVLDNVVNTSEDNVEAWYLLAYANYSAGKYSACRDCVGVLHQLFQKPDLKDQEIEDATAELETKLKEIEATQGEKMEEAEDDKEEDYEDIEEGSEKEDAEMGAAAEKKEDEKKGGDEKMETAGADQSASAGKGEETMEDK